MLRHWQRTASGMSTDELQTMTNEATSFWRDLPRTAWRAVVDFWTKPVRAEPLAMMRILAAICVLASALTSIAPNLSALWFDDGLIPADVASQYMGHGGRFSVLNGVTSQPAIIAWFVLWMVSLLFVLFGCFTRTACAVAWLLALSFNMRVFWALNGGDDVGLHLLFYLMISPSGAAWSIDALRRRLRTYRDPPQGFESPALRPAMEPVLIPPWSVRLIQIQLIAVYLLNGINKLNLEHTNDYLTGEAVYWALNDVSLTRFAYDMVPFPMWLCRLLSWGTIVFELGFPILVLIPRLRPWALVAGVLFHVGIFATLEIGWFSQMTLCYYPIYLKGHAVERFAAWLVRAKRGKKYIVCYDTFCPVCRRSKFALELMDVGRRLTYRDIHDRAAMERDLPGVPYARALKELLVVAPGGKITGGFDAFRSLAWVLPALWPVLPLMYLPGVPIIGRWVYQAVARNRYRLVKCDDGVCNLHLMALSKQTLNEDEIAKVVQRAREAAGASQEAPANAT